MTSPPRQRFVPSEDAVKAVLIAIALKLGEPLTQPDRLQYSISRPDVEAAAGRSLTFDYVVDELNPFGRLDIIVLD